MRWSGAWLLVVCLGVFPAAATAPLGGDDAGFVPPTQAMARCQEGATKNVAKLGICLAKCHVATAAAAFDGAPVADEFCEAACIVKYQEKAVAVLVRNECPVCLDQTGFGSALAAFLDQQMGVFYCAGVVPLVGDDGAGFVPPDRATLQCESRLVIKASTLMRCVLGCHAKQAARRLAGVIFEEEVCEDRCQIKLVAGANPGVCPQCLAFLPGVVGPIRDFLDGANDLVYCTSPGGAFLDEEIRIPRRLSPLTGFGLRCLVGGPVV